MTCIHPGHIPLLSDKDQSSPLTISPQASQPRRSWPSLLRQLTGLYLAVATELLAAPVYYAGVTGVSLLQDQFIP